MTNIRSMNAGLLFGCVAIAPTGALAQQSSDDWQVAATVYGWFPDIGGNTQFASGTGGTIDVDISTILDHLKMTFQGAFEVRKGHWGAFTDVVYLDVGESGSQIRNLEINGQPIPGSVTTAIDFDLKSVFWTMAGTYRVAETDGATFDVLLGARLATLQASPRVGVFRQLRSDHAAAAHRQPRRIRRSMGCDRRSARTPCLWHRSQMGDSVPLRCGNRRFETYMAGHAGYCLRIRMGRSRRGLAISRLRHGIRPDRGHEFQRPGCGRHLPLVVGDGPLVLRLCHRLTLRIQRSYLETPMRRNNFHHRHRARGLHRLVRYVIDSHRLPGQEPDA